MTTIKELRILNLGGGVQSTDLYLMAERGEIPPFDYAITSDTQDEAGSEERRLGLPDPEESFYAHMDWLGTRAEHLWSTSPLIPNSRHGGKGCPILVRTRGQISADLLRGENSTGQKFASIPAYTSGAEGGDEGQTRRQCTKEYKIEVIDRCIRYEILGLSPGNRIPKDVIVHQYIGISWDERSRAFDIARRFETAITENAEQENLFEDEPTVISVTTGRKQKANWRCHFPLIEDGHRDTRADCTARLEKHVPHKVWGSSCMQCPYKDDPTWRRHMEPGPTRERLIEIDAGIRTPGVIANRNMEQKLYLHRACRPIDQIDFSEKPLLGLGMAQECEGGCGL
jgi:hypothetical protein